MIILIHGYEVTLSESYQTSEIRQLNRLFVSLWISNHNDPSSLWETGIVQRPLFICSVEKTNETWSLHVCTISLTVRLSLCDCLDLSPCWKALVLLFFFPHVELQSWFTVEITLLFQIVFMLCFMMLSFYGTMLLFVGAEHWLIPHYRTVSDSHDVPT